MSAQSGPSLTSLDQLIPSRSEMADLVRAHDWSSTPLGPIESWSAVLLTSVNLVLASPFSSALFWGPELIFFYNDAYRPIMSAKHPDCLGSSGPEVFREAWPVVDAEYSAVFYRGESVYREAVLIPLLKDGKVSDFFFDYALTPVYNRGVIVGVHNRSQDVTAAVVAQRRLRESETRTLRVLQSIGDAVIVTDAEARVTRMNPVAEALTGWTIGQAAGIPLSTVFRIVNEHTRETVESPADKVIRLGTIVGLANHTILIARDGSEVHIDDSGAPIRDDDGNLTGIVLVFRDIGERRAAEREREKLADQLHLALQSSAQGTWVYDPATHLVIGDEQTCRIFGCTHISAPPDTWVQLIHPEDQQRFLTEFGGSVSSENPYDSQFRVLHPDGIHWVRARGHRSIDEGKLIGIYGVLEDITVAKQAEIARLLAETRQTIQLQLLQQQRRSTDDAAMMRAASEAVGKHLEVDRVGFFELSDDDTMNFTLGWINEEACAPLPLLHGPLPVSLIGTGYLAEVREGKVDGISDVRTDTRTIDSSFETIGVRSLIGVPIIRNGKWTAGFYVLHSQPRNWTIEEIDFTCDVGEQAWDAIERARVQLDLRNSEEQMRQILSSTRDCIKVLDLEGNLLSMNDEGKSRLGIDDLSAFARKPWAAFWNGESSHLAQQALAEAIAGRAGTFEGNYTTSKGEDTWWDNTVTPIRDAPGNVAQLLVVSREVTQKKQTEEALRKSEKLAAVGRLASSIAHEINNPLESVTNLLYLARNSETIPEVENFLAIAERELRRVSVIASQTLRFHKQAKDPRPVTADDLLETVLSIYQGRLINYNIEVQRRRTSPLAVICFDGEIRQVLNNLVANAIDSMNIHGGKLVLNSQQSTNWKTGKKGLKITVADTGSGMTPTTRKRLFEAFFTTKGIGGAGLGLWLSKDIVDRHGGQIKVRSSQEPARHGTVFTLFLPFDPAKR